VPPLTARGAKSSKSRKHRRRDHHIRRSRYSTFTVLSRLHSCSSALIFVLTSSVPAAGCPNCALGDQVRAAVWYDMFFQNLVIAGLPFLLATVACLNANAISRWLAPREGQGKYRHE
jgi:hypothetical protein